jgi:hypothetical protein
MGGGIVLQCRTFIDNCIQCHFVENYVEQRFIPSDITLPIGGHRWVLCWIRR